MLSKTFGVQKNKRLNVMVNFDEVTGENTQKNNQKQSIFLRTTRPNVACFFLLLTTRCYLVVTSGYFVITFCYLISTTGYFSLLLATFGHVSDPINDFPRPILNVSETFHCPLITPS